MSGDILISQETAIEQVQIMLDYYEIDLDEDFEDDDGTEDSKKAAKRAYGQLVKDTKKGRLNFDVNADQDLMITQTLKHPLKGGIAEIVYKPVTGKAKTAMKAAGANDNAGKLYAFLGGLASLPASIIGDLQAVDLKTAECLGLLFLAV